VGEERKTTPPSVASPWSTPFVYQDEVKKESAGKTGGKKKRGERKRRSPTELQFAGKGGRVQGNQTKKKGGKRGKGDDRWHLFRSSVIANEKKRKRRIKRREENNFINFAKSRRGEV